MLDTQLSARLRDQMIAELNELGTVTRRRDGRSGDTRTRTGLNEADAEHIDQCFRTKLLSFAAHDAEAGCRDRNTGASRLCPTQWTRRKEANAVEINRQERPCRSRSRAGCGIASTSGMSLSNPAWSVAASPATPITCASRKAVHSDARSAMSSLSRCAAGIIASFTDTAMKPNGGVKPLSSHSPPPGSYGLRRAIRCAETTSMARQWLLFPPGMPIRTKPVRLLTAMGNVALATLRRAAALLGRKVKLEVV